MSKIIVIVGLSGAGVAVLQGLVKSLHDETYRIIAINAQDFAYWPIGALRASVIPGWEDKIIAPLTGLVPHDGRHLVLGGSRVTQVDFESKRVVLDAPRSELGGNSYIDYEYIVIATGSDYGIPCRPPVGTNTQEEARQFLKTMQRNISSAQDILIVGAGPVGIEMAGEIASYYASKNKTPKKKVTLVSSSSELFPQPGWKDGLRNGLKKSLSDAGVELITGAKGYMTSGGKLETGPLVAGQTVDIKHDNGTIETVHPDFLFAATGNSPNTSMFPPSLLAPSKRLRTDSYLAIPGCSGAFALGDAIDADVKMVAATGPQAGIVVKNIMSCIRGKAPNSQHKDFPQLVVVPVGPHHGAGQLFGMTLGGFMTSQMKGKGLFLSGFQKNYPAEYNAKTGWFS